RRVRVQIVLHQDDFFDVPEVEIADLFEDMCIIDRSAAFRDLDVAPTFERREQHEQICRAVALVLVVVACRLIVDTKTGDFEPSKFEDQYETAVKGLLKKKQQGEKIEVPQVINLMDALRRSVEAERSAGEKRAPAPSVHERSAKKKPARSARHKRVG